jgi:hypothetical protein
MKPQLIARKISVRAIYRRSVIVHLQIMIYLTQYRHFSLKTGSREVKGASRKYQISV